MKMWDEHYTLREDLVTVLERDLVGPRAGDDERITDDPVSTYACGVIYPQIAGMIPDEEQDDTSDDADEVGFADPPVSLANTRYPSSMGLTFAVDTAVTSTVSVQVKAARYRRDDDAWQREPVDVPSLPVNVTAPATDEQDVVDGLVLYSRVRQMDARGVVSVTLALVNRLEAPSPREKDAFSWYQCGLQVTAGDAGAFVDREPGDLPVDDADLRSYRLIYRDARSFAVGHGISVAWEPLRALRADVVETAAIPRWELLLAESNSDIPADGLTMRALAQDSTATITANLTGLVDGYEAWIAALEERVSGLPETLVVTARDHLAACRDAARRMRSGVELLERDPDARRAFRLSNQAMLRQRARAQWIRHGSPGEGPAEDDSHAWRPFQIAFILINLDGIVDPQHPDRDVTDLLWFPTGGGKTEAYLGLIGFTILLRRLRKGDAGAGVAVIMRYTLRLLTIQQFERATALIVALEDIRRSEADLGTPPITIGLWVGRDGTPRDLRAAREALDKLNAGATVEKGNPMQVRACPWCGSTLTRRAYWIARDRPRLVISCPNEACAFSSELPVKLVDQDIYEDPPALLIATADKFATLPWVKRAHRIFGIDTRWSTPELIVQDELHLISGPLGTLAGLYEAAIDLLCTNAGVRPKVIASTATIRRAGRQTRALFDRDMRQFPPPGLDADDSFFAVTAQRDQRPSRLYVGAMAPGISHSMLMIRVYAALLEAVAESDAADEVRDAYWTLVGYFNSLRVLGGAKIQVLDDVSERMRVITSEGHDERRIPHAIELTSREPSSEIPRSLARLAVALPDDETLDYVLATNMISVGVDIDRLGMMVVMGQPQGTAEYIQATSRVGRQTPGLVVTLLNASRSRDRSHYESFPTYHGALYRQVESASVTPFSPRARDRALHALVISLARMLIPDLRENDGARRIAAHVDELRGLIGAIVERAERVDGSGAATEAEFERVLSQWLARADEIPDLVYTNPRDPSSVLMTSADRTVDDAFPTPSSLRDVDSESNLYLVA